MSSNLTVGSRYYGLPILTVPTGLGTSSVAVFRQEPPVPSSFLYYTVRDGDRLDVLANKVYGRPDYWWKLADANPELFYPDQLIPGAIIRIPTS
jgi:nucleoid-associated protein YgaU